MTTSKQAPRVDPFARGLSLLYDARAALAGIIGVIEMTDTDQDQVFRLARLADDAIARAQELLTGPQ